MSDGPLLTWKGRRVRSPSEGPEASALKVPAAPRPGSLFFVPSPLEGWGLDVLLDRLPSDSAVALLEIDPDLRAVCDSKFRGHLGPRSSDSRLHWLEADTEAAIVTLFGHLPLASLRRCEFLTLGGAWLGHGPRYREVFQRLEAGLKQWWANRATSLYLGPLWVRNLFDNLCGSRFQPRPWPEWGTQPVLVCGAGVTLESALPHLSEFGRSGKVLAVDTALPVLRAAGVVPDGVVCVEAQQANLRDFAGWVGKEVPLFADLTAHPPSTRVFASLPYWFVSEFAPLSLWNRWPWENGEVPLVPPLGSVGVVAAWVAWRLTSGPVVFAGLDFSYPPGKTHARGAPALGSLLARTDRLHPADQPGTWLRPGQRPLEGGWITTQVLETYGGLLAERSAQQANRTWVWDRRGWPLGLKVWPRTVATRHNSGAEPQTVGTSSLAQTWLEGERDRWKTLLREFEILNAASAPESVWPSLKERLREVDYLTFAFPDPEPRLATDWLVRVLSQIHWASTRFARPS